MNDFQKLYASGALINAALYLALLGIAGLMGGDRAVIVLVLGTAGTAYVSYVVQLLRQGTTLAIGLSVLANVLGLGAGVLLLMSYWARG